MLQAVKESAEHLRERKEDRMERNTKAKKRKEKGQWGEATIKKNQREDRTKIEQQAGRRPPPSLPSPH